MTEEDAKSFIEWLFARCNLIIDLHNYVLRAYDKKTKNECYVKKYIKTYIPADDYICYGTSPASRFRYAIDQMFSGYDIIVQGISIPIKHILRAGTSFEEMLVKYDLEKDIYAQQ